MLPLPPRSTLFPYTTLFRSNVILKLYQNWLTNNIKFYFLIINMLQKRNLPKKMFQKVGFLGMDLLNNLRSEEHTSELQSQSNLVCRLLLEKKKKKKKINTKKKKKTKKTKKKKKKKYDI